MHCTLLQRVHFSETMRTLPFLFVLAVLLPSVLKAQQISGIDARLTPQQPLAYQPEWIGHETVRFLTPEGQEVQRVAPKVKGGSTDTRLPNLPVRRFVVEAPEAGAWAIEDFTGNFTEEPSADFVDALVPDLFPDSDWYPAQPVQVSPVYTQAKRRLQVVTLYPMQVHADGLRVRRYAGITYTPTVLKSSRSQKTTRTYAQNSVLASGTWYKVAVGAEGVYQINPTFLESLGVEVAGLNPNTLRLFYNGGGVVPQDNSIPRPDDLAELPVVVTGSADGRFDPTDKLIFYAQGPSVWTYDSLRSEYYADPNPYTDSIYLFLNVGQANGARITTGTAPAGATYTVSTYRDVVRIREEKENILKMGRTWVGDVFNTLNPSRNYALPLEDLAPGSTVEVRVQTLARNVTSTSSFDLSLEGIDNTSYTCSKTSTSVSGFQANPCGTVRTLDAGSVNGNLDVALAYNGTGTGDAWLWYIEAHTTKSLRASGTHRVFRIPPAPGIAAQKIVVAAAANYEIWDVTDPLSPFRVPGQINGTTQEFFATATQAHTYVAVNTAATFAAPRAVGPVANQNLHALPQAAYIMVAPADLLPAANRLADLHRGYYQRTVHVVDAEHVYNEFGAGRRDVSAIRDFVKMFYDRAQTPQEAPQYLLLMGDASFDNKGILSENRGRLPSQHACEGTRPPVAYSSDDIFGFLDDNEGRWNENCRFDPRDNSVDVHKLDIAIGRIPAQNLAEANVVVDKTIDYVTHPERFGDWRTHALFVADWKDGETTHTIQSESMAEDIVGELQPCMVRDKVYIAAYPKESTAEGERFPKAGQAWVRAVNEGALFINYTGHGGEEGLSSSFSFEMPDILGLENQNRYAFWITATCEFGRYDDFSRRCGAEQLLLNETSGAVGIFTATRQVYIFGNDQINDSFWREILTYDTTRGRFPTFGEALMRAKNNVYDFTQINTRNFALLGDPALVPNMPYLRPAITHVNQVSLNPMAPDTLRALGEVTMRGEVRRPDGTRETSFTGEMFATVYDKATDRRTIYGNVPYSLQEVRLFNGRVSVEQGQFEFTFTVPLDIDYNPGNGRVNMYATDGLTDGFGCTEEVIICCTDPNASLDDNPPQVQVYINDYDWKDGAITGNSPTLLAVANDDRGINTTGLGVGRELTAVLNDDAGNPYILNDYFRSELNNARAGVIEFPLDELPAGTYTVRVKVWDVTNKSGTGETTFIVADDAALALQEVLNYPNPFTNETTFSFQHNRAGEELDVAVRVYNRAGQQIVTLRERFTATGNVQNTITWDGRTANGAQISGGLYFYELVVKVPATGEELSQTKRLVYLR